MSTRKYQNGGFDFGSIIQNLLSNGGSNFLNTGTMSSGDLAGLFGDVFNGQMSSNNAAPTNIQLVNGFHGFQDGGSIDNRPLQGPIAGGEFLNLSPVVNVLSEMSNRNPVDLMQLALETRRHESGRNFNTDKESKTKQFSGGPGRGAYQIEAKSLPTLAKKARHLYREANIIPNKVFRDIEEGKITDASELDPQFQEDLFYAGFTQFDNDGNFGVTRSLKEINPNSLENRAQLWFNVHNRSDKSKEKARKRKYLSDNGYVPKAQDGGQIPINSNGLYEEDGPVIIPSNNITMKGIKNNVLGIGDGGEVKLMKPNRKYLYKNSNNVLEIPIKK